MSEMSHEAMSDDEYDQRRASQPAQKPVREHAPCSKCNHVIKPFYAKCPHCEGVANRIKVDALADVIRELKNSTDSDMDSAREQELFTLLLDYGHPDPKGFMSWLQGARDDARSNKPKRKEYRR